MVIEFKLATVFWVAGTPSFRAFTMRDLKLSDSLSEG